MPLADSETSREGGYKGDKSEDLPNEITPAGYGQGSTINSGTLLPVLEVPKPLV